MPGTVLAALQFFFALTWVVYVIYLPALAEQAGLERRHVPMILLMDQVIFLAFDWAAGVYADRTARLVGRIGVRMAAVALVSCGAFILLPWIAPAAGAGVFLALTALWSATSSALRAPPFAIVSRYANAGEQPWVACSYLFGIALASAIAPYLAIELRQVDPRIPFALSSVSLAVFVLALAWAERTRAAPHAAEEPAGPPRWRPPSMALFVFVVLLFAFGYQVHFTINSAKAYLRFATQEELPLLRPVFWIGFNLALVPATLLVKRLGGTTMMVVAGTLGVIALASCAHVTSLKMVVAAQAFAGAAWSLALVSAFSAALELGRPGREGLFTGILFSTLAAAAIARLAMIVAGLPSHKGIGPQLEQVPFIAWALAAFLMALVAHPERARAAGPAPLSRPGGR